MRHSAKRFFSKALAAPHWSTPRVITVDKNAAYPKAFKELKSEDLMPACLEWLSKLNRKGRFTPTAFSSDFLHHNHGYPK
jgi:transposase-like protein